MKIIDAIRQKGKPFQIPDCSRDELPEFFKHMGYKVGAEIGVYAGDYTEKFCQAGIEMYAIDPWTAYSGMGRTFQTQSTMDEIYQMAHKRLSKYDCVHIVKMESMKAVRKFDDNSLDFVYIDGNHDFRHVAEDLYEWSKKVRSGGAISGHDYYRSSANAKNVVIHVEPIVDAYVEMFDIDTFYTFGTVKTKKKRSQDKHLSWMWIKK